MSVLTMCQHVPGSKWSCGGTKFKTRRCLFGSRYVSAISFLCRSRAWELKIAWLLISHFQGIDHTFFFFHFGFLLMFHIISYILKDCWKCVFVHVIQGTLRPDLIESASTLASGKADAIKTHHNDTDLVRELREQVCLICTLQQKRMQ